MGRRRHALSRSEAQPPYKTKRLRELKKPDGRFTRLAFPTPTAATDAPIAALCRDGRSYLRSVLVDQLRRPHEGAGPSIWKHCSALVTKGKEKQLRRAVRASSGTLRRLRHRPFDWTRGSEARARSD